MTVTNFNHKPGAIPAFISCKRKEYMDIDLHKIILYTVSDIQTVFKLGRTKAYALMSSDGFPSFRMNNRLYVEEDKLRSWVSSRAGKSFNF